MIHLDVTIDGRPLVGQRTGIGVHAAEIARRLAVEPPPLIASHAAIEDRSGVEECRFRVDRAPNGIVWQQFLLPRIGGDVLWGPHGTLPLFGRTPAVVTLHDFTSITMPLRHRLKTIASFNMFIGRSLERARRIACVSRSVADQAIRSFGVAPSKVEVVPNGVDAFFSPTAEPVEANRARMSSAHEPERDYILYAGTIEPRKGIAGLMAAWRALPSPRPRLVLCGGAGWGDVETEGAELTGYVSRERLRELYRGALAFVYPSLYEGFGMPPLEAMACGAPVIATRTGAITEYATGSAVLVEPGDEAALAAALRKIVGDPGLRSELRAAGPQRARDHGWQRSATLMTDLLAEAAR